MAATTALLSDYDNYKEILPSSVFDACLKVLPGMLFGGLLQSVFAPQAWPFVAGGLFAVSGYNVGRHLSNSEPREIKDVRS